MNVLRSGTLLIPGGNDVKDAKKIHSSTWQKLLQAQTESFRSMFWDAVEWQVGVHNIISTVERNNESENQIKLKLSDLKTWWYDKLKIIPHFSLNHHSDKSKNTLQHWTKLRVFRVCILILWYLILCIFQIIRRFCTLC